MAFLPMTVLRSGEVQYDGSNREVKLVAHIQSKKARSNLWAVMKHDKSLEDVDFEPGGKKYRKRPKAGEVVRADPVRAAEWEELKKQAEDLAIDAPAEVRGRRHGDVKRAGRPRFGI